MATDLLPPNASPLERALSLATSRLGEVDAGVDRLLDPATCDLQLLPWLAWGLSVDTWDADWTEAAKREAVATSIALHRRKGTRASVEEVARRFDSLIELVEWHQAQPAGVPHTFDLVVPMVTGTGVAAGGARSTAAFIDAIVREVSRIKPLREHMTVVQQVGVSGFVGVVGVARVASLLRRDAALTPADPAVPWSALLQTEDGEPLQSADGSFLDTTP